MGFLQSNFNQFIGLRQMIWRKKSELVQNGQGFWQFAAHSL